MIHLKLFHIIIILRKISIIYHIYKNEAIGKEKFH